MARDHAQIRLDMWGDDDWRELSPSAQHLYMLLLTSPTLNFCGVVDWRPARIARLAHGWTPSAVEAAADELQDGLFLILDVETEEALIRSFVRHDGLMKSPNMATAMSTDHAAIASSKLRSIVVHELRRLREKNPDLAGWRSLKALAVLERQALDPRGNPSGNPSTKGSVNPSTNPSVNPEPNPSGNPSPTPTPTPAPNSSSSSNEEELPSSPRGEAAGFAEFYDAYPRKVGRKDAAAKFAIAARKVDPAKLIERAAAFAADPNLPADRSKIPHPATWLHQGRWDDEPLPERTDRQLSIVPTDRRLTTSELENVLGMDVWTCPRPPRDLDDDAAFAWTQRTIREHSEQRQQLARERMGRTA